MASSTAPAQAEKATTTTAVATINSVRGLLLGAEAQLAMALPQGIPVSYMIRVVLTAVQRTPKLLDCHPITLLGAVFQAAQLGLVPDGVLGQAYLVPFKNTKKNRMEVQFIPGYRGLITLVRRSGELSTIDAEVVREKDKFEYVRGTDPKITHIPYTGTDDPGKITNVWAMAKLKDGGYQIVVMTTRDVEKIKKRSAAVKAGMSSPWDTDPEWMFKKTALKQVCKLLPVSVETQRAMALDDRAEVSLPQDLGLLADPENETATAVDEVEGEVVAEIQMPQRMADGAPQPEPATEPVADQPLLIINVEEREVQATRGKTDEQVKNLGLTRKFFYLVTDSATPSRTHSTWSRTLAEACTRLRDAKTPVEIDSQKKNTNDPWPQIVQVMPLNGGAS